MTQRLIIGITGASGISYGIRLLEVLKTFPNVETHLIVSKAAEQTRHYETDLSASALTELADVHYHNHDIAAALASGSFRTDAMVIIPCSMKTLAEIAHGFSQTLISRTADVMLKERRKLIVVPRETPLHLVHLENMVKITQLGAIVAPAMPAFYNRPQSIDDILNHTVGRVLDLLNLEWDQVVRWQP